MKYPSNFRRTFATFLFNCEINLNDLNWSRKCVIFTTDVANEEPTLSIADTKFYVLVVTLSALEKSKIKTVWTIKICF